MSIHPTAIVEDGAALGKGVSIGPYCRVGAKAKLRDGVVLQSHVVVEGRTEIGPRTVVYPFAVLGGPPQHLAYRGEETMLIVGADNVIREHATMNCGTVEGGGVTRVGAGGMFMTGAHIAHDCQVGDKVILANCAAIGGHVILEDHVFLGGLSAVHQRARIGAYAFVGGCAAVNGDIIPYGSAFGNHAYLAGLNLIGLKRRGAPREVINDLRAAYSLLFSGEGAFQERVSAVETRFASRPEVMSIIAFVKGGAERALVTPAR